MEGSDAAMVLDEKVVDELIKGKTTDEVFGKEGVLKQLVKAMTGPDPFRRTVSGYPASAS